MRKSANIIDDAAVGMFTGIENIEIFLEENDQWQFHDSGIRDIHWDDEERRLSPLSEAIRLILNSSRF